jgi:hypothetical protein
LGVLQLKKTIESATPAVEAHMFGRMDERLDVVELLNQYLEDPRPRKEVLEEIIERISAKGT